MGGALILPAPFGSWSSCFMIKGYIIGEFYYFDGNSTFPGDLVFGSIGNLSSLAGNVCLSVKWKCLLHSKLFIFSRKILYSCKRGLK